MPPRLELEDHRHESAQLCFVLEGRYSESWNGSLQRLQPGSALFRPARTDHSNRFAEEEVLTLLISFREGRPEAEAPRRLPDLLFGDLRTELVRELRREDESAWALEGLALLMGARLGRWLDGGQSLPPGWLREARFVVGERFREQISLGSLADLVGVHRTTLAAGFRHWFGTSVGDEIRRRRILEAISLLEESDLPISTVAVECGFHDQPHLTRTLRKHLGATPLEIRSGRHRHR